MKELSIEDKAKLYDEALIRGSRLWESDMITRENYEYIFPELKKFEDEDERIRKAIIEHFANSHSSMYPYKGFTKEQIIAWLEKRGEQKCAEWHREDEQNLNACLGYIPDEFLRRWLTDIIHVKYDKPTDKAKPKSKAGDWVVCNNGPHHIFQVIERSWPNAKYRNIKGTEIFLNVFTLDKQYHLWTIQDAKDGDVLVDKGNNIGIYKEIKDIYWDSYIFLKWDGKLRGFGGRHEQTNTHPATKEQCEQLEKAMADAGYTFDFEKKELKKIEQKPAWSEEDENRINRLIAYFEDKESFTAEDDVVYANWLKSIKDRVQPKQEWSKEDKDMKRYIGNAITCEESAKYLKEKGVDIIKAHCWLESLKDRYTWKPTEEQMQALKYACGGNYVNLGILESLYQDLKKLTK